MTVTESLLRIYHQLTPSIRNTNSHIKNKKTKLEKFRITKARILQFLLLQIFMAI